MRRGALALCVGLLVLLAVFAVLYGVLFGRVLHVMGSGSVAPVQLILDPGHGGEDGGAVSPSGTTESPINLAIALRTEQVLAFYGQPPVVLRREEISLHDPDADTIREKKVSDLHNRVDAIQAQEGAVVLSIHQNSYPQSRYHGAQVFFAPTPGSQALGEHVQQTLCTALQPDNTRQPKKIPDSIYLMNHISCPAVLVECGFLSNPEEERMLCDPTYQTQMAAVLAASWLTAPPTIYFSGES